MLHTGRVMVEVDLSWEGVTVDIHQLNEYTVHLKRSCNNLISFTPGVNKDDLGSKLPWDSLIDASSVESYK